MTKIFAMTAELALSFAALYLAASSVLDEKKRTRLRDRRERAIRSADAGILKGGDGKTYLVFANNMDCEDFCMKYYDLFKDNGRACFGQFDNAICLEV